MQYNFLLYMQKFTPYHLYSRNDERWQHCLKIWNVLRKHFYNSRTTRVPEGQLPPLFQEKRNSQIT